VRFDLRLATAAALLLWLPAPLSAGEPERTGVVFVVGGIGGIDPLQWFGPWALSRAEVRHEVRVFEWTHGKGHLFRDLQDTRHLLAQAERLAGQVRSLKAENPGQRVYLVGHSGGAAVVLAAAERLPPATLERVVLLSAAVSPTFDLRDALRATRGEIVSFHSRQDRFLLGWFTSQFGTADRVYGPAAGLDGFEPPPDLDEEGRRLYARLVQVPWRLDSLLRFRGGGHQGTTRPIFLATQVAPWLQP
jgi:pimeloyl-ACP methyl ester carboxylesterase